MWLGLTLPALAADPVETEVKIGLACEDLAQFPVLGEPKTDHITFFEKPGRPFQRAGIILRKRTGDHADVTVKYRPRTPSANPPTVPGVEVEGDWTLKSRLNTWSFKIRGAQFTPEQMTWLASITPEKPEARGRVELESERWKWNADGLKVSIERWSKMKSSGGDCLALEISTRVETAQAESALAELQRRVAGRGVRIQPSLQENKTARVLDLLLGRAR
jgi:hypothetical protein